MDTKYNDNKTSEEDVLWMCGTLQCMCQNLQRNCMLV